MLLLDCLRLWDVEGRIAAVADGIEVTTDAGSFLLQAAPPDMRPVRWLLHTPDRRAAHRPPRAAPSIGAALLALRHAVGGEVGNRLQVAGR
jgi:hypothetical protein